MNRIIETYTTSLGYDIRIVGGAVRDLLQNKTPKDIDFATTALPDQIIELCQQNNVRHYLTGLKMYLEYLRVLILDTRLKFESNCIKNILTFSLYQGLQHGTISALIDDTCYEVTTLRTDLATDGRHAVVKFTDEFKVDATRRDLTSKLSLFLFSRLLT